MKNLENFGVQELSAKEITQTTGGSRIARLVGYIFGALIGNGPTHAEQTNRAFT